MIKHLFILIIFCPICLYSQLDTTYNIRWKSIEVILTNKTDSIVFISKSFITPYLQKESFLNMKYYTLLNDTIIINFNVDTLTPLSNLQINDVNKNTQIEIKDERNKLRLLPQEKVKFKYKFKHKDIKGIKTIILR